MRIERMKLHKRAGSLSARLSVLSFQFSVLAVLLFAGCVERTLTLRSDPPGATVVVNGDDVGTAPVRLHFDTYGVFEVILSYPRYDRLRTTVPVNPPWYEKAPLDFFSENVWPITIHDDHDVTLPLKASPASDDSGIDRREQQLRERTEGGSPATPDADSERK